MSAGPTRSRTFRGTEGTFTLDHDCGVYEFSIHTLVKGLAQGFQFALISKGGPARQRDVCKQFHYPHVLAGTAHYQGGIF